MRRGFSEGVKNSALPPRPGIDVGDVRKARGCQLGHIRERDWLIDLDCEVRTRPGVSGCAQATGLRLKPDDGDEMLIALRGPIRISGSTCVNSAAEKESLRAAARKILAASGSGDLVPLTKAIAIIGRAEARSRTMLAE